MAEKKIRWGMLGAGGILDRWMKGAAQVKEAEVVAVASRTMETARRQAGKFGIPSALTYDEILERKDIDVMYIPVPHTGHKELAIRAMNAGFPVLVEKPAGVTAADWEEMTACAEKNGVFLMEAVWTRCFPITLRFLDEVRSGRIGEVRNVQVTFAFRTPDDYTGRLTDPDAAGGALLDVGVYDLHFLEMLFGKAPSAMVSLASFDTDELHLRVDEQSAIVCRYDRGELAVSNAALRTNMPDTACVYGTKGYIRIPDFWKPCEMEIVCPDKTEKISMPIPQCVDGILDEGYQFEIRHVHECLENGLKESPLVPHSATETVMKQCDALRREWNFRYPFEQ